MELVAASVHRFGYTPDDAAVVACVQSGTTVEELEQMTGAEKRKVLTKLGITTQGLVPFLRSMQHVIALQKVCGIPLSSSTVRSVMPRRSANSFSQISSIEPLCGHYDPGLSQQPRRENRRGTARREFGAVGLRNQGATCYLNSLLQALFHLPLFRRELYNLPVAEGTSPDDSIHLALQLLFANLDERDEACETRRLTKAFGWTESDAFYQQDVAELQTLLLDNLSEQLLKAKRENFVKHLFYGASCSYFVVPANKYEKKLAPEDFHALSLVAVSSDTIYQSLDMLVEPVHLEGSNQYCLENEDGTKAYVDAVKETRFNKLPPILFINVQRTTWDVVNGNQKKVLTRWEFYDELDLSSYSAESELGDCGYHLHSVMVHAGHDPRHGHYYSFVRSGESWLKFNDETVEVVPSEKVFGENFGGEKMNYWGSASFQPATAYMLVYVRDSSREEVFNCGNSGIPANVRHELDLVERAEAQLRKADADLHLTAPVELFDLTAPDFCLDTARLGRVKRITEGAPRFPKQHALREIAAAAESFWTYTVRESGHLHIEKRIDGDVSVDDLPRVFPHTIPTVFAVPFCCDAVCTHLYLDADEQAVSFVAIEPVRSPAVSVRGRLEFIQSSKAGVSDVVHEFSEHRVQEVSDDQVVCSGETYVWFDSSKQHPRDFYHFQRHKVQVHVHSSDFRKGWPLLSTLQVADDTPYPKLQEIVGKEIKCEHPSHLRFSKFNPETGCPRPQRLACKESIDLKSMLTMPSGLLSDRIYVDICEVPAVEADDSNYIRFEVFNDSARYVSTNGVILPEVGKFTVGELIDKCRRAAGIEDDEREMRFVDIWKGRFYAAYTDLTALYTEPFQALADYRLEFAPQRIEGSAPEDQVLVNVSHVSRTASGFSPHSDPFSLWILRTDLPQDVLKRVARKLKLPEETVCAWNPAFTINKEIRDADPEVSVLEQMSKITDDLSKVVVALEHTALPGTRAHTNWRREEGVKIRN